LGIRQSLLGSHHESTIRSMGRLGTCLGSSGGGGGGGGGGGETERKDRAKCLLIAANRLHEQYVMVGISKTLHAKSSGARMRKDLEELLKRRGE
jgi:hypothetical protein